MSSTHDGTWIFEEGRMETGKHNKNFQEDYAKVLSSEKQDLDRLKNMRDKDPKFV